MIQVTRKIFVAALPIILLCSAAQAQTISKSTLSGTILTKGVTAPAHGTATILTTPATGFFILTQTCGTPPISFGTVVVSNFGGSNCTVHTPGLAVPAGTPIICDNTERDFAFHCFVTGVLSKK